MQSPEIMPTLKVQKVMPYTQEQMYALVADIEKYAQFLPYIKNGYKEVEIDGQTSIWVLECQWYGIGFSFSTKNSFQPNTFITMQMHKGGLEVLIGRWDFIKISDAETDVVLHIEYALPNKITWIPFQSSIDDIAQQMLDGFKKRAAECYGVKKER